MIDEKWSVVMDFLSKGGKPLVVRTPPQFIHAPVGSASKGSIITNAITQAIAFRLVGGVKIPSMRGTTVSIPKVGIPKVSQPKEVAKRIPHTIEFPTTYKKLATSVGVSAPSVGKLSSTFDRNRERAVINEGLKSNQQQTATSVQQKAMGKEVLVPQHDVVPPKIGDPGFKEYILKKAKDLRESGKIEKTQKVDTDYLRQQQRNNETTGRDAI